jgi:hypothetical protein
MSVKVINGIGYSELTGTQYINMAAVKTTQDTINNPITPTIPQDRMPSMPWSPWGTNNLQPQEMAEDIKTCGILNSIIDGKARFAMCQGMVPAIVKRDEKTGQQIIDKYINDAEIEDFLDNNNQFFQLYGWMKDLVGYGQCVARIGLNRKKSPKITRFLRDDVTEYRSSKKNAKRIIPSIWLSAEWARVRGKDDPKVIEVPLLDPNNPALDLQKKVSAGSGNQFAITFRYPDWTKHYYSDPLWWACLKWVKIAQGVPEMKAAIFENSIHVKYVVVIYEKYWEKAFGADNWKNYSDKEKEEKINKVYDDIDQFLVGSKNAYKSVFTTGYRDQDGNEWQDIKIIPVEDYMKDGKLLPDSAAANSEIAFAMHYNNAIIGGNQPAGPYEKTQGGSNVRESVLLQIILHEIERQYVRCIMNVIAHFNGWKEKFPGLQFIIPATILTTLDTGGSTKPITTGSQQNKEDGAD